jgi:hypothetical protein
MRQPYPKLAIIFVRGILRLGATLLDLISKEIVWFEDYDFFFGLWGKSPLVCAHTSQRAESHSPIKMRERPELVSAVVTLRRS